jgi:hypothetical protein
MEKTTEVLMQELRQQIAKDLEALEVPTGISSDWFAATSRTKMAAIAIVLHGLPKENN